jgi:hypothetical protein
VDIREYLDTPNYSGPTKKGVRFGWEKLPEVVTLIETQAKRLGAHSKSQPALLPDATPEWVNKTEQTPQRRPGARDAILTELLPDGPKPRGLKTCIPCMRLWVLKREADWRKGTPLNATHARGQDRSTPQARERFGSDAHFFNRPGPLLTQLAEWSGGATMAVLLSSRTHTPVSENDGVRLIFHRHGEPVLD